jgi:putative DNA primase/helicase
MNAVIQSIDDATTVQWPAPKPLITAGEIYDYPLDALPAVIRDAVVEVQSYVQAPVPLVVQSALTAVAISCQAHYNVARDRKLVGPVSLNMLALGESGERKTTCDGYFNLPIREHELAELERVKPEQVRYNTDKAAWDAIRSGLLTAIKQNASKGKSTDQLEGQLQDMQDGEPMPPRYQRILFSDVTPEALLFRLATVWPSGAIASSEGGAVFGSHGMNADSQMRNLSTLNQLWGGESMNIDRKTSDSFTLSNPRLTVALMVQPETLQQFIRKSGNLARGSGFFARFLISVPESTQGKRPYKVQAEGWPHLQVFYSRLNTLLSKPVMMQGDALDPSTLGFSNEATAVWVQFHDAIELALGKGGFLHDIQDAASKVAENVARLAALFEIMQSPEPVAIGAESVNKAAQIASWHLNEAQRFFSEIALPEQLQDAVTLDQWLTQHCADNDVEEVTRRDIQRMGPSRLRRLERLELAMDELVDADRVRVSKNGTSTVVSINPALVAGGKS